MKKISEYVEFFTSIINAIAKGIKIASDHWPTNNPFSNRSNGNTDGVAK